MSAFVASKARRTRDRRETHGNSFPNVSNVLSHGLEMGRSIVTLGDEDVVLLAIGRRGVQRVDRDEPAGARANRLSATGLGEVEWQRCDSLFLDGAKKLKTGQQFTLGNRSLDDGRHDGDVEVGRADVLRRRDASDVDVYMQGDWCQQSRGPTTLTSTTHRSCVRPGSGE